MEEDNCIFEEEKKENEPTVEEGKKNKVRATKKPKIMLQMDIRQYLERNF